MERLDYKTMGLDYFDGTPRNLTATDGVNNYAFSVGLRYDLGRFEEKIISYGGIVVVDNEIRSKIPQSHAGEAIFMQSLKQIAEPSFMIYDHTTIGAMQGLDFRDQQIVDFGSGSGLLSILALLRGAKSAVMIDLDESLMQIAQASLELNGISKDRGLFIPSYIENIFSHQDYQAHVAQATMAIANIGPQPIYGGDRVQMLVFRVIKELGLNIRTAILGGFANFVDMLPDSMIEKYGELGFHEVRRVWMQDKRQLSPMAVVLERQPAEVAGFEPA